MNEPTSFLTDAEQEALGLTGCKLVAQEYIAPHAPSCHFCGESAFGSKSEPPEEVICYRCAAKARFAALRGMVHDANSRIDACSQDSVGAAFATVGPEPSSAEDFVGWLESLADAAEVEEAKRS